jgi:hypothetical protein
MLLCIVGIVSPRQRVQAVLAILSFGYLILRVVRFFDVPA